MQVYVLTLIMFVTITLLIYVLARFSPIQWEEPSNCIRDPTELTNQYNFLNSFWFILGAFMQQGSDVCPESLSVRWTYSSLSSKTFTSISSTGSVLECGSSLH